MEEKLKFQLIQLTFIKKEIESLQNEQKKIKLCMNEHLQNKQIKITSLNRIKLEAKSLFGLLNETEKNILELEDYTRRKKLEHIDIENDIVYWQKKRDNARASLDSANNAQNIHKEAVQELKNTLELITKKLTELSSSEGDIIEFHNSQVLYYYSI